MSVWQLKLFSSPFRQYHCGIPSFPFINFARAWAVARRGVRSVRETGTRVWKFWAQKKNTILEKYPAKVTSGNHWNRREKKKRKSAHKKSWTVPVGKLCPEQSHLKISFLFFLCAPWIASDIVCKRRCIFDVGFHGIFPCEDTQQNQTPSIRYSQITFGAIESGLDR